MLQNVLTLKTYAMKDANHKKLSILWFHWYDMSKIGKSIASENRLGSWEVEGAMEVIANGFRVSCRRNILKLDCGNDFTTMWIF